MNRWITQNKIRPGVYLNFIAVTQPAKLTGDRGIGTMAIPMDWGDEGVLIDVYSTELASGASLSKVGVTASDTGAKLPNLMLSGCYLGKFYRLNSGGTAASGAIENLTILATKTGILGNEITVAVTSPVDGTYRVITYVRGSEVDRQDATTIQELASNDYVVFSGTGNLTINAGTRLVGGTNGTINASAAYTEYLTLAKKASWQCMALTQDNAAYAERFANFTKEMWEDEGRMVQVAVANYSGADSYSVINSDCGVVADGVTITPEEATAWIAGITAGAAVNQSNVNRVFTGATKILNSRSNSEIIEALEKGMFILSANQNGDIVVENDINSLHTLTDIVSEDYKLNQVIRVLAEIGTSITSIWQERFKGKVQNNDEGRKMFKSLLVEYFNELQALGAIEDFAGAVDITIERGDKADAVLVTVERVKPVAAMATLYGLIYTA